ncbi:MAG TPA: DUF4255 domain-containing protein, partial [Gemmatimonadales bacterium]
MLAELHTSLQHLLRERGLLDVRDVDIEFDPPAKAWIAARIRPTLNLFLFDIQENTELRQTAMETTRGNGRGIHRMPPRRFDLRYLISALTTDVLDEHLLLWRAMVTLLKHPVLPVELLPESIRRHDLPVQASLSKGEDGPRPLDIWSALESPPRPSLLYTVTVPVDLEIAIETPLVFTRTARYTQVREAGAGQDVGTHIGGVLRDRKGLPIAGARVSVEGRVAPEATTNAAGE